MDGKFARLMLVASSHGMSGENADLFVWAKDRAEAIQLWREHWDDMLDDGAEPDHVFIVPGLHAWRSHSSVVGWGLIDEAD